MIHKDLYTINILFTQIARGDEAAYSEFFEHYFQQLYGIMLVYTKRPADAEDIVQSIFLKVWEKRAQLATIENPENWLIASARNEFLDRFRKIRSEENYRHYLSQLFQEEQGSPEDLLIVRQRQAIVQLALAGLSEKQQQAFLLSRQEGLTYEQIGERMGIARTTVKEHIARALKAIKVFLLAHKDALFGLIFIFLTGVLLFFTHCVFFIY